jgi:hypothetical protein
MTISPSPTSRPSASAPSPGLDPWVRALFELSQAAAEKKQAATSPALAGLDPSLLGDFSHDAAPQLATGLVPLRTRDIQALKDFFAHDTMGRSKRISWLA